ncbi:Mce-associated membrane protein [Crossiella equi]|uniref:Mce-associated membrane protein n=1 Tax=Crossiella equi TaxID=130796 RepID=A0ABS5AMK8_9PSEU|nr:hypothetical protein [Crossiella equi]MBP2477796.1 Mce-associated membrane protein [Crossiella equi]
MAPTRRATAPQRRRPPVAGTRLVRPRQEDSEVEGLLVPEETSAEAEPGVAEPERPQRTSGGRTLYAVAAALLALAGFFAVQGHLTRSSEVAANQALVNGPATAEVAGQVGEALRRVFSYKHDDTAATEQAAAEVLTDTARTQYDALFAQVREQAPRQKLVLATKPVVTGVRSLAADRAVLLVFLDQTATRGDTNETSASAAQLGVTAKKVGEKWLIAELQPR